MNRPIVLDSKSTKLVPPAADDIHPHTGTASKNKKANPGKGKGMVCLTFYILLECIIAYLMIFIIN
jgi:hypothetical protein